jgi:hypothetical protein
MFSVGLVITDVVVFCCQPLNRAGGESLRRGVTSAKFVFDDISAWVY